MTMSKQKVEVVCPVTFWDEEVNVAMLKRMMDGMKVHDSKIFSVPGDLEADKLFSSAKKVVGLHKLQFVREYTDEPQGLHREAWFFGRVKPDNKEIIVRASIRADKRTVEFFVATTDMPAITGLLAELGHDLTRVLKDEGVPEKDLRQIIDQIEKDKLLRETKLLLHKYGDKVSEMKAEETKGPGGEEDEDVEAEEKEKEEVKEEKKEEEAKEGKKEEKKQEKKEEAKKEDGKKPAEGKEEEEEKAGDASEDQLDKDLDDLLKDLR
jgi:hypothetical protein